MCLLRLWPLTYLLTYISQPKWLAFFFPKHSFYIAHTHHLEGIALTYFLTHTYTHPSGCRHACWGYDLCLTFWPTSLSQNTLETIILISGAYLWNRLQNFFYIEHTLLRGVVVPSGFKTFDLLSVLIWINRYLCASQSLSPIQTITVSITCAWLGMMATFGILLYSVT